MLIKNKTISRGVAIAVGTIFINNALNDYDYRNYRLSDIPYYSHRTYCDNLNGKSKNIINGAKIVIIGGGTAGKET